MRMRRWTASLKLLCCGLACISCRGACGRERLQGGAASLPATPSTAACEAGSSDASLQARLEPYSLSCRRVCST
jgi:hypothetical protein